MAISEIRGGLSLAELARARRMTYDEMVAILRTGRRLPAAEIDGALAAAGRSAADLVRDVLTGAGERHAAGDRCPMCKAGFLRVTTSKRGVEYVTRYLRCGACGWSTTSIVPAATVPKRRNKTSVLS